ncbi:MAG: PDZ domain-containing protein [Ruminococcaceae bacterium]|nr:PDZ domain-containing protein [Oscillospiraceae bacterium]
MREIHENNTQYQTGKVAAPRTGSPLVAILLVAVVLLCGVITVLSLMNIKLTAALKQEDASALQLQSAAGNGHTTTSQKPLNTPDSFMEPEIPMGNLGTSIPQGSLNAQQIYANCIDSVVTVNGRDATGTGVIVASEGYIITNCHVVSGAERLLVTLSDDRQYEASLVGADPVTDLAVVQIHAEDLSTVSFGDSEALQVGDSVCAIGGAERNDSVTNGTVSAIDSGAIPLIRTDGSWLFGEVSGPLIDRFGRVVAIQVVLPGAQEKTGVAIPISAVRQIVQQLIGQGYVSGRPGLGIDCEPVSERYQHLYDLPAGLYITQVLSDQAGDSLAAGDILLTLDGQSITTTEELEQALYRFAAGDSASVEIFRDGNRVSVTVTFDEAKG